LIYESIDLSLSAHFIARLLDDDNDVPIKLAKGVYGDRFIDREPKSSAIRSFRDPTNTVLHTVSLYRLIHA